jgi:alkylation response protein AidB-like acyl-CoA dehydrogenase
MAISTLQEEPGLDVDGVFQRIQDVLPTIRQRRQEIETGRRLPRDLVDQLSGTGIFRLGVPRSLGGVEARPTDLLAAIESVATADGSAGWCAMIGVANGVSSGYLSDAGAREMFADPAAPTAGIAAPAGAAVRVDGGVRVTGRWGFASGITHCDWAWAGCIVVENGQPRMTPMGPEIIHVCVPVSELEVHDTWYVSGLCGTGSNDFSARDVFIPARRIFALLDPSGHRPEPLYQMPPLGFFASQLVCVSLGIARSALDELIELAQTKVPTLNTAVLADKPVAQVELARAEAALAGARSFLFQSVEDIWQTLSAGRRPTQRQLALGRMAALHAAETGANVARVANVLAGGSSLHSRSPLQRHARDAEAVTHHFTVTPLAWEDAGRVLLGRDPSVPAF